MNSVDPGLALLGHSSTTSILTRGTLLLVLLAIMKAIVWPAFLVYHLLALKP